HSRTNTPSSSRLTSRKNTPHRVTLVNLTSDRAQRRRRRARRDAVTGFTPLTAPAFSPYFVRGSSAGFTYVIANGPIALTSISVWALVVTQWFMLAIMVT